MMEEKPTFQCFECSKLFTQKGTLNRHVTSIHQEGIFVCHNCGEKFNRNFGLKRYMDNCGQSQPCDVCDTKYETTVKYLNLEKEVERGHHSLNLLERRFESAKNKGLKYFLMIKAFKNLQ